MSGDGVGDGQDIPDFVVADTSGLIQGIGDTSLSV
jgi:hypothetical protein